MRERTNNLAKALAMIRAANPPARIKVWDTETNTVRSWKTRQERAVVARAFLESARLGIDRTYWYMWTTGPEDFLGVEVLPNSPGKLAYRKIHSWIAGAKIRSCRVLRGVATCNYRKAGKSFSVHWAVRKSGTREFRKATRVCSFSGQLQDGQRNTQDRLDPGTNAADWAELNVAVRSSSVATT